MLADRDAIAHIASYMCYADTCKLSAVSKFFNEAIKQLYDRGYKKDARNHFNVIFHINNAITNSLNYFIGSDRLIKIIVFDQPHHIKFVAASECFSYETILAIACTDHMNVYNAAGKMRQVIRTVSSGPAPKIKIIYICDIHQDRLDVRCRGFIKSLQN